MGNILSCLQKNKENNDIKKKFLIGDLSKEEIPMSPTNELDRSLLDTDIYKYEKTYDIC